MAKTLESKVEYVLQNYPTTRNSDIELTIKIWAVYHNVGSSIAVRDLFSLPREDSIKRIRARIQNDQLKYLPTSEAVTRKRKMNIQVWRQRLGYTSPVMPIIQASVVKETQRAMRWDKDD